MNKKHLLIGSMALGAGLAATGLWFARSASGNPASRGSSYGEIDAYVDYLSRTQIPLEMCSLSNVCTAIAPSLEEHPIRLYFEMGLLVTVNTDDPMMFNNSLAQEYRLLVERLDFTPEDVRNLILNGVRASWLPVKRKEAMLAEFQIDSAWNYPAI